jgi:hypothetical protein
MPRLVVILGMHRSGTSCLAGSLEEAGLHLGEVITSAPHNAKGNRENRRIMALHEDLLQGNGGTWRDPPEHIAWSAAQRAERDAIVTEYAGAGRWGFKDPRTLFTLDGWLEAHPNAQLVGVFRHPTAVARSLERRNRMPLGEGIALWTRYNARLLAYWKRCRFPLVSFDENEQALRHRMARVFERLELRVPEGGLQFFEPTLRHHQAGTDRDLPPAVQSVYDQLREAAA